MTWPKRKRRDWTPPGPLRVLAERLSGRVFEGPPRVVLAEISDVLVMLTFGRARRPTVAADWLHGPYRAPPRRNEGPLTEQPCVRAAVDRALHVGLTEATSWPARICERGDEVSLDLVSNGRAYDVDQLEAAMRFVAAFANAPWPELAMLRALPEARPNPPPDADDLYWCFHEPEVHPRRRDRSVDLGERGIASVADDGTITFRR